MLLLAGETSGRMRVLKDGTLEVFDVQRMDSGSYTCIVNNEINNQLVSDARLSVLYGPIIVTASSRKTVHENDKITLRCEAEGYPVPSVSWFTEDDVNENDIEVTEEGKEHLLTIFNVKEVHAGKFICEAKNKIGVVRKDFFLEVGGTYKILVRQKLN